MTDENRWAFLAKEPTITKIQDLLAILRYVVNLRHEDDGNPLNDPATLRMQARKAEQVSWHSSRIKFVAPTHPFESQPDSERKMLVDYWLRVTKASIFDVLSCQTDRDSAIWLERRMSDEDKNEQLDRWQVSDKKVAPTLKRIDAEILARYKVIHAKNKT